MPKKTQVKIRQQYCNTIYGKLPLITNLRQVIGNPDVPTVEVALIATYKRAVKNDDWICIGGYGNDVSKTDTSRAMHFFKGVVPAVRQQCFCGYPMTYWTHCEEEDAHLYYHGCSGEQHFMRNDRSKRVDGLQNNYYITNGKAVILVGSVCREKFLGGKNNICLRCGGSESVCTDMSSGWLPLCEKCIPKGLSLSAKYWTQNTVMHIEKPHVLMYLESLLDIAKVRAQVHLKSSPELSELLKSCDNA